MSENSVEYNMEEIPYKEEVSLDKRKKESSKILEKYPDRLPVIVERLKSSDIGRLDKKKYLVPHDLTIGQFMYVIRKRLEITSDQAIFLFVNNTLPPSSVLMSDIYMDNKDEDGFLYILYSGESTFG